MRLRELLARWAKAIRRTPSARLTRLSVAGTMGALAAFALYFYGQPPPALAYALLVPVVLLPPACLTLAITVLERGNLRPLSEVVLSFATLFNGVVTFFILVTLIFLLFGDQRSARIIDRLIGL